MVGLLRIAALVLVLAAIAGLALATLAPGFSERFATDEVTETLRGTGAWGIALGIGLICADVLLPVPTTTVMTALGVLHGPLVGGLAAAAGSFLSGLLGYGLTRALGHGAARRLAGRRGLAQAEQLFARWGGWLVALSRWLPVLPETVSFAAGLVRMPIGAYAFALACGAVPLGFGFATLGHLGAETPALALVAGAVLPVVLWALLAPRLLRHHRSSDGA